MNAELEVEENDEGGYMCVWGEDDSLKGMVQEEVEI